MVFPVVTFTHKLGNVQIESLKFIQFSLFEKTVTWQRGMDMDKWIRIFR